MVLKPIDPNAQYWLPEPSASRCRATGPTAAIQKRRTRTSRQGPGSYRFRASALEGPPDGSQHQRTTETGPKLPPCPCTAVMFNEGQWQCIAGSGTPPPGKEPWPPIRNCRILCFADRWRQSLAQCGRSWSPFAMKSGGTVSAAAHLPLNPTFLRTPYIGKHQSAQPAKSKRSRFITFVHASTKSLTNFSLPSPEA